MTSDNTNSTDAYDSNNYSSIPTNFKSFVDIRYLLLMKILYIISNSEISYITGSDTTDLVY